ncbi:MAG: TIGR00730 family Rossman fold protein [Planctomycetes bacterium]|nr:TIGR00730 family Rossman fold protein [Planctomycetota bacterium]
MTTQGQTPAENLAKCLASPSYLRAYEDMVLLHRTELRPVRLQLELLKAEMLLQEQGIESTVVLFGSARTPPREEAEARVAAASHKFREAPRDRDAERELLIATNLLKKSRYYEEAVKFGRMVSSECQAGGRNMYVVCTGGGPGIMEAGNRGAWETGAKSCGMNITLPHEQAPNPYITPELCFQFHYFAIRKMHLLLRAKAAVFFPGGFGTLDELFETLTLVQTRKMAPIPIVLVGHEFWSRLIEWKYLVEEGVVSPEDIQLFRVCETAEEIWAHICAFNKPPDVEPGDQTMEMMGAGTA